MPKMLLDIHGEPMLKRIVNAALDTENYPITVVVGAHKTHVVPILKDMPINITDNPHWQSGMASSIKMGLVGTYLISKEIEGVIITTGDVPGVNASVFSALKSKAMTTDAQIIVSEYGNGRGVPALIKRALFEDLLNLEGDEGVRQLFSKYKDQIATISFKAGSFDIDTREDYLSFLQSVH
jgi:molybdenum cofactor cytidylyltransferase